MKYVVAIVIAMAAVNAFIMWCMCAAAGREDQQMEELMRKKRDEENKSGASDNKN